MSTHSHVVAFDRPLIGAFLPAHSPRRYTEADLAAARAQGFREGTDSARAFADQQMVDLRAEVQALQAGVLGKLVEVEPELHTQVREALPLLAVELAQRLLAGFVPPPELVERLCREALDQLYPEREGLELVVCPRDASVLERLLPGWRGHFPDLKVTIDDTLVPGDCLVRSRFGVTDARGMAKLEALRRELLSA